MSVEVEQLTDAHLPLPLVCNPYYVNSQNRIKIAYSVYSVSVRQEIRTMCTALNTKANTSDSNVFQKLS